MNTVTLVSVSQSSMSRYQVKEKISSKLCGLSCHLLLSICLEQTLLVAMISPKPLHFGYVEGLYHSTKSLIYLKSIYNLTLEVYIEVNAKEKTSVGR